MKTLQGTFDCGYLFIVKNLNPKSSEFLENFLKIINTSLNCDQDWTIHSAMMENSLTCRTNFETFSVIALVNWGVYIVVAWRCLKLPSKFVKLWCFLRILLASGIVKNLCSGNSDFIKIFKNEGSDVGNIARHHKLMLPVMLTRGLCSLKYTNHTYIDT